eukprot:3865777-Amphidinium_carterae.1
MLLASIRGHLGFSLKPVLIASGFHGGFLAMVDCHSCQPTALILPLSVDCFRSDPGCTYSQGFMDPMAELLLCHHFILNGHVNIDTEVPLGPSP